MEQVVLGATPRVPGGKGAARTTRRDGLVPGVVYGLGHPPITLAVSREELQKALKQGGGSNVLIDLQVENAERPANAAALVKEMQRHPVSRIPESVDFQWVSLAEMVQVSVQVVMEGTSEAVKEGAMLDLLMHDVEVECLPGAIPQRISVNVDGIQFHETRTVADLQVPSGVRVLADVDTPVVACLLPTVAEAPREVAPVEGEVTTVDEA